MEGALTPKQSPMSLRRSLWYRWGLAITPLWSIAGDVSSNSCTSTPTPFQYANCHRMQLLNAIALLVSYFKLCNLPLKFMLRWRLLHQLSISYSSLPPLQWHRESLWDVLCHSNHHWALQDRGSGGHLPGGEGSQGAETRSHPQCGKCTLQGWPYIRSSFGNAWYHVLMWGTELECTPFTNKL